MAKLKNLFVGCPVTHKDAPGTLGIAIRILDTTSVAKVFICWESNSDLDDEWYKIDAVKLAPFPDADKAFHHLNLFENV